MTESVRIYKKGAGEITDIVYELKDLGYKLGVDFDFAYRPSKFSNGFSQYEVAFTEFMFYNNSLASWFVLKYS